jgi:hypothetical protein
LIFKGDSLVLEEEMRIPKKFEYVLPTITSYATKVESFNPNAFLPLLSILSLAILLLFLRKRIESLIF